MVVHVGANPKHSAISMYNTETNTTESFVMDREFAESNDKIINLFLFIREKVSEPFGCFCVMLDAYVDDETRQKFLDKSKKFGFKKAEIISVGKAEIINMLNNIPFEYGENDYKCDEIFLVFHILPSWITCFIWEKTKYNGFIYKDFMQKHTNFNIYKYLSIEDLESLKSEAEEKYRKISKVAFYDAENSFCENKIKQIFPDFHDTYICRLKPWDISALLYARYLSGDATCEKFKSNEVLIKSLKIKCDDNVIINVPKYRVLPLKMEKIVDISASMLVIQVFYFEELVEYFELHNSPQSIKVLLTIDTNTIASINFIDPESKRGIPYIKHDVHQFYYRIPGRSIWFEPFLMGIGIDFGTTKCCLSVNRKGKIDTVALDGTERIMPTYVSFDEMFEKFGQLVVNRMMNYKDYTVFDIKRILGIDFNKILIDPLWPFEVLETLDGVKIRVETINGKRNFSPEEISAAFFKNMKTKIEEYQGSKLTEAVITIPASTTDAQKAAIKEAANLGGWKIVHLLPEPIAAAFIYCDEAHLKKDKNLLVFDLGGGTLNIFLVTTATTMLKILSNDGSSRVGGRDFDKIIIDYFTEELKQMYDINVLQNENKKFLFMANCKEIKETLSVENTARLSVEIYNNKIEDTIIMTRELFEELSSNLVKNIQFVTERAVAKSKLSHDEVDVVLQVGGGCRMPMIKNLLTRLFPKANHCCAVNPDWVVAEGAALYACLMKCKYP